MKFQSKNTKSATFTIMPRHEEMIKELIETREFFNKSQVVRDAISFFHKKYFPYYKVKEQAKDEAVAVKAKLQELPNERYCVEILGGDIETKPGLCFFKHNNPDKPFTLDIPLANVKNFSSREEVWKAAGISPEDE